jgi:hypothetical protein
LNTNSLKEYHYSVNHQRNKPFIPLNDFFAHENSKHNSSMNAAAPKAAPDIDPKSRNSADPINRSRKQPF